MTFVKNNQLVIFLWLYLGLALWKEQKKNRKSLWYPNLHNSPIAQSSFFLSCSHFGLPSLSLLYFHAFLSFILPSKHLFSTCTKQLLIICFSCAGEKYQLPIQKERFLFSRSPTLKNTQKNNQPSKQ